MDRKSGEELGDHEKTRERAHTKTRGNINATRVLRAVKNILPLIPCSIDVLLLTRENLGKFTRLALSTNYTRGKKGRRLVWAYTSGRVIDRLGATTSGYSSRVVRAAFRYIAAEELPASGGRFSLRVPFFVRVAMYLSRLKFLTRAVYEYSLGICVPSAAVFAKRGI